MSSVRRNTSTRSGTPGRSASDGYTGRPRISVAFGLTNHTSYELVDSR